MKRGISTHWGRDYHDQEILVVEKARGKLTLDEIRDAIMTNKDSWSLYGHYVIILNCAEGVDTPTWGDWDEPAGDNAVLYRVQEMESCPVCGHFSPLIEYCQNCGEKIKYAEPEEKQP